MRGGLLIPLLAALLSACLGKAHEKTPMIIVALGDSTTAGTPGFRSPLEAPPDGNGDVQSQYAYWLMRAEPGWRVLNRGVNGERADEIRARFARDVEDTHPRFVVVLAGVNDVYQGRPLADTEADLSWMYRRAKSLGIVPVAASVLPFTAATAAQNERLKQLNSWILGAAKSEGIPFCDAARAVADPQDAARLNGSPDGLHPDIAGYRALGEALAKTLKQTR